ncbi:MAG: WecB/TagA/CpsF family glycosyltransferase [Spirochaetia bacterium]|nr:WecB/TagA/CpsF family glycosyltransferase [Spirochaetia bacterium]
MNESNLGLSNNFFTNKEDNDPILEYKQISTSDIIQKKINIGYIPFYRTDINGILSITLHKLEEMRENKYPIKLGVQHVLPIDPYKFIHIHRYKKYLSVAKTSFINLPSASGMLWMSRMLKRELPQTITTVSYAMSLLRLAHAKEYTIFLVGTSQPILEKLYLNLNRSFPNIRIVGRHHGFLKGVAKQRVLEALKKTDPHIILLGLGFKNEMKWIYENKGNLGNCILVSMNGYLDILAGARKKNPNFVETREYGWLWRAINRPHRWPRLFSIFWWVLKVLYWKMFKAKTMTGEI